MALLSQVPTVSDTVKELLVCLRPHASLKETERIADTRISLPCSLTRFGLSGIVNHMLGQNPPRPYDFLGNGIFLRTSLEKYAALNGSGSESILDFEYLHSVKEPELQQAIPHADWIADVDATQNNVLSACYDGGLRLWSLKSRSAQCIAESIVNAAPVKAAKWISETVFVSGGKDKCIRVWNVDETNQAISLEKSAHEHIDSVEAISVLKLSHRFASAGWDGCIYLWSALAVDSEINKKRVKSNKSVLSSLSQLKSSEQSENRALSCLCWPDTIALYSGGYDHLIKQWNPESGDCVRSFNSKKLVTTLDFNSHQNLIASGHNDNSIRIWDIRSNSDLVVKSYTSHSKWVSAVKWSTINPNMLISGAHDGKVKFWDLRSTLAMYTIDAHMDKVLAIDFHTEASGEQVIVTAGADNEVKVFKLSS